MPTKSTMQARGYVQQAELPAPMRSRDAATIDTLPLSFDTARNEAAVVGADAISFVSGVTAERREAIIDSSLLAQLVAKKKVGATTDIQAWYDAYFDVLANIGWVVQQKDFAEYHQETQNFEAHEAVMAVATTLLSGAPTTLALVKTTLDALHSMSADDPWITIFNRESQSARTAHFRISLAEQDEAGRFFVTLMAFGLEANSTITQVLFFKLTKNAATLRHCSGKVTIDTAVLDALRPDLRAKLVQHSRDYVRKLPDL
jgi:hypothetical protein